MKQPQINLSVVLLLALAILVAGCGDDEVTSSNGSIDNTDFVAEEIFSFENTITTQTGLRIVAVAGNITINGMPGINVISVSGVRRVGSESLQDAQDHLQFLEVTVTESTGEILVQTTQPSDTEGRQYEVDYIVNAPNDLLIHTASVAGNITVHSMNSGMAITHVAGEVVVDGNVGSLSVGLTTGQISGSHTLTENGMLRLSMVSGDIDLDIPQNTSASFAAVVQAGTVTVTGLTLTSENVTPTGVTGILGTGQGTVTLSVAAGTIAVTGS